MFKLNQLFLFLLHKSQLCRMWFCECWNPFWFVWMALHYINPSTAGFQSTCARILWSLNRMSNGFFSVLTIHKINRKLKTIPYQKPPPKIPSQTPIIFSNFEMVKLCKCSTFPQLSIFLPALAVVLRVFMAQMAHNMDEETSRDFLEGVREKKLIESASN